MAALPNKRADRLKGVPFYQELTEDHKLLPGNQRLRDPGKGPRGYLPGPRYRALLLAVILLAGFLPVADGAKDYQISAGAGYGGSIQPSGLVTVESGGTPLFSIIPAQGFRISIVVIDGAPVGAVPVYTFAPVHDDHMIFARFVRITGSLNVASDPIGTRIYIDDQFSGTIPDQRGLVIEDVAVGGHTLRFVLAGYQTVKINARVEEGEQTVIPLVVLTPEEVPTTTVPTSTATTIPTTAPTTTAATMPTTVPTTTVTTIPTAVPTTTAATMPTTVPTTTVTIVPTTTVTTISTTAPTTIATTIPTTAPTTTVTTIPTTEPTTTATTMPTTVPATTDPTPTPEPAPSPSGTGGLYVVSDPTAMVMIQGVERGRSNEVIEGIPAGSQAITLSRPGYTSRTMMVDIDAGRVTVTPKVTLELTGDLSRTFTPTAVPTPGPDSRYPATGALFIYTVPFGCSLSIDDIPVGMTPKLITSIPPGAHTVNISLPGYGDVYREVTVRPDDISVVLVMMTPDFRSIGSAFS